MAAVKRAPERTVFRLRFKGTFSATFVNSTWSQASSTSSVMFIACSSLVRKIKLPTLMVAPIYHWGQAPVIGWVLCLDSFNNPVCGISEPGEVGFDSESGQVRVTSGSCHILDALYNSSPQARQPL